MKLIEYKTQNKLRLRHLAKLLGISLQTAHRYCAGIRCPSPAEALRISLVLGGEVTVADLLFPDGPPADVKKDLNVDLAAIWGQIANGPPPTNSEAA